MDAVRRLDAGHARLSLSTASPGSGGPVGLWLDRHCRLLLAAILVAAAVLRLRGIDFGLPALNDPDEIMFEMGSVRMLTGPTLNPGWFGHPATTTIYLLSIVNALVFIGGWLGGAFPSPQAFAVALYHDPTLVILPGRLAMFAFAMGTVALTFRLGSRLFGPAAGLAAAALLAFNPVHITYSQIIRSDMMACLFMLLGLIAAHRILHEGAVRHYLWAALWMALALATKWPFGLGVLPVILAGFIRARREGAAISWEVVRLALFATVSLALLLAISPFLVLDFATVQRDLLGEAQQHHLGATGGSALENAWWYLRGPLFEGLGLAGLVLTLVGMWMIRRSGGAVILLPLIAAWMVLICIQTLVWERWALPLMPLLVLCAGFAAVRLADLARAKIQGRIAALAAAASIIVLAGPLLFVGQVDYESRTNDTRQQAARWALANIPAGSTVLVEHFGFDLLAGDWNLLFPIGEAGCLDVRKTLAGQTRIDTIFRLRGSRHNVDYGTTDPSRRAQCRFDYAILTQMDRYRAERDRFPQENAAYDELVGRGQVVASFEPRQKNIYRVTARIVRLDRSPSVSGSDGQAAPESTTSGPAGIPVTRAHSQD